MYTIVPLLPEKGKKKLRATHETEKDGYKTSFREKKFHRKEEDFVLISFSSLFASIFITTTPKKNIQKYHRVYYTHSVCLVRN